MAINNVIDLDAKLSLTKTVRVAGKDYLITISDKIDQAFTELTTIDLPIQLRDIDSKAEKLDASEESTAKTYKEFTRAEIDEMRNKAISTLDVALGTGEGQRVYEYYGSSTKAVMTIIGLLQTELDKVMIERKKTADNHYKNSHKNGKKK